MENALDKALANASLNAKMNGDSLHTENLDSIADPTLDQFDPNRDGVLTSKTSFPNPRTEFELLQNYQQQMESEYAGKAVINSQNTLALSSIDYKLGEITNAVMYTHKEAELTKLRLDALADMVTEISTTITKAASMSSEPNYKHRSLHEWDDSTLLNELVERENDLMPFYFELLKRIGSSELQSLVMSSMQGKNSSMITLARLCSALAPNPQPLQPVYEVGLSQSAEQRMDEAFHAATTPQTYTQAQLDNLRFNGQSSGITVEEIALYERMQRQGTVMNQVPPQQQSSNPFIANHFTQR